MEGLPAGRLLYPYPYINAKFTRKRVFKTAKHGVFWRAVIRQAQHYVIYRIGRCWGRFNFCNQGATIPIPCQSAAEKT